MGPFTPLPNRGADNVCGVDNVRVVVVDVGDVNESHDRNGKALAACVKLPNPLSRWASHCGDFVGHVMQTRAIY
jgi:hypothetical protein